jgi:hypothetical protein
MPGKEAMIFWNTPDIILIVYQLCFQSFFLFIVQKITEVVENIYTAC